MTHYIDTSALIRLLQSDHPDHPHLVSYFDTNNVWSELISSELLVLELNRFAIRDQVPTIAAAARMLFDDMQLIDISKAILREASSIPVPVKTLDAIHIATALAQAANPVITYDLQMSRVLQSQFSIQTVSPGGN